MGNIDCCPAERPKSNGLRLLMPLSEDIVERITERLVCTVITPEHLRAISILAVKEHDSLRRALFPSDGSLSTTPTAGLLSSDLYQYLLLLFVLSCYSIPHLLRSDIINLHALAPDSVHHVIADKYASQYGLLNDVIAIEEAELAFLQSRADTYVHGSTGSVAGASWTSVSSVTKEAVAGALARELQWPFHTHNAKAACLHTLMEAARTQVCAEESLAHAYAPLLDVHTLITAVASGSSVDTVASHRYRDSDRDEEVDSAAKRAEEAELEEEEGSERERLLPIHTLSPSPSPSHSHTHSPSRSRSRSTTQLSKHDAAANPNGDGKGEGGRMLLDSDAEDDTLDMRVDTHSARAVEHDLALLSLTDADAAMLGVGKGNAADMHGSATVTSTAHSGVDGVETGRAPDTSRPRKGRPAPLAVTRDDGTGPACVAPLVLGAAGIVMETDGAVEVFEDAGVLLFGDHGEDAEEAVDSVLQPLSPLAALSHDHSSDDDDGSPHRHSQRGLLDKRGARAVGAAGQVDGVDNAGDGSGSGGDNVGMDSCSSRRSRMAQRRAPSSRHTSPTRPEHVSMHMLAAADASSPASTGTRERAFSSGSTSSHASMQSTHSTHSTQSAQSVRSHMAARASPPSSPSPSPSRARAASHTSHVTRTRTRSQSAHRASSPPPRARSPSAKGLSRARWYEAVATGAASLCKLAAALSVGRSFPAQSPAKDAQDSPGSPSSLALLSDASYTLPTPPPSAADVFRQGLAIPSLATHGPRAAASFTALLSYFLPSYSSLAPLLARGSPLSKTLQKVPATLTLLSPPPGVLCLDQLRLLPLLCTSDTAEPLLTVGSRLLHTQVMKTLRRVIISVEHTLCTHSQPCAAHTKTPAITTAPVTAPALSATTPRLPAGANVCVSELEAHVRRALLSVCRVQVELATMQQEAPVYHELATASQLVCVAPTSMQRPLTLTIDCSPIPTSPFLSSHSPLSPPALSLTHSQTHPRALPVALLPSHLRWADWQQLPTSLSQWRTTTSQNINSSIAYARKYVSAPPDTDTSPFSPASPLPFAFHTPTANPHARRILYLVEQPPAHATLLVIAPNALTFVAAQTHKVNSKLQQQQRASSTGTFFPDVTNTTEPGPNASPQWLPVNPLSPSVSGDLLSPALAASASPLPVPTHLDAWVVSWLITYIAANTSTGSRSPLVPTSRRSARAIPLTPQHVPAQALAQATASSPYVRVLAAGECFSQADVDEGRVWVIPHDITLCGATEDKNAHLHCGRACTCVREKVLIDADDGVVRVTPGVFRASSLTHPHPPSGTRPGDSEDSDGDEDMFARARAGKTRWGSRRSIVIRDWVGYSVQCSDGRRSEGHRCPLSIVCEWE